MRYYTFTLDASADQIKKDAKIRLSDYEYDNPIGAMNKYIYRKMNNGMTFIAYGTAEGNNTFSVFSYDESKYSFEDAYDYILEMMDEVFCITRVKEEPYEITAYQFFEYTLEAKRRGHFNNYRIIELANLRIYDDYDRCNDRMLRFDIEEKIISGDTSLDKTNTIYDADFIKEISNIEGQNKAVEFKGNMVHYVLSTKSVEATSDMTETLMNSLFAVKRIDTKRMVIIKDIDPEVHKSGKYLEEVIENNYGGVVVIDLSEKFGYKPVSYGMASKYIEKLVKKYRNNCLFVFTYNMDNPGFAYSILPNLNKYVVSIELKEGKADRKTAVKYMEKLIRASEYSEYASQAGEFMKRIPGDEFSQTDVLQAFEQFGAWAINKNILKAYDFDEIDDFSLARDEDTESSYKKLNTLIGLNVVKEQIENIIAAHILEKERKKQSGNAYKPGSMHMIFAGNPGSAKTTVAKLLAGIAKEKGVLKSGAFVEVSGTDFNGPYCVATLRSVFDAAKGGVLFIDEAYGMYLDDAITTLIQEMENRREEVMVILAGYNERIQVFMERNEGLKSRIPYWIDFPDYNTDELVEIFKLILKENGFSITEDAIKEAWYIFDKARYMDNFGNGRYVRNLAERVAQCQSVRLLKSCKDTSKISKKELFLITREDMQMSDEGSKDERVAGAALKELEDMIGLSSVKEVIKKAMASFKIKKYCIDRGIYKDKASMHMVFMGNPGTAKTTVARIFAEIMKDENLLPTGKFLEVGRADLVGNHVGETAQKVKRKFGEAQGGVLFIDEAYSLCDNCRGSYGDEAINTIVQEMENHREDTIVVFAGYPNEMQAFLDRNPGLSSRIAFHISFDDYSVEELCYITKLMLAKKKISITDGAMEKIRENYEVARKSSDYGNGRYVRKLIEEAEMNLAQRIYMLEEAKLTTELITTIEECDVPEMSVKEQSRKNPIGF